MDISVVIVNWNGWAVLKPCLESLFNAPQSVEFEVIVVDNASRDESVASLETHFPLVRILRNDTNRGFAAANNQGFAIAKGRYILLLNNDTLVLDGALARSLRFMDANPTVGALGCRVEFPDRSFQTSCYRFNGLRALILVRLLPLGSVNGERLNFGRYWGRQFKQPTDVEVIAGCYMVVRREVIASAGPLDEDFFMYGEDEEWCSRIWRAGWRIVYFPDAVIIHLHRFSSRKARRALRVIECMAPVLVLHKRRGAAVAWCANAILLAALLIRLPFWLAADSYHIFRGSAQEGLLRSRFTAIWAHLKGLVSPVWLPNATKPGSRSSPTPHND